ncbi:MAG: PP2C family protein-serine/threonine phosphatase [Candidatus Krumholzibacteriia bacterium]|nr:PP2C family protein-serine/threonine phosphatase [bacterium]MCB9513337.1 PP2C family protein-serine/threonine phosphatase [Candidatus Latescibacterota bacterium]MCB9516050.1 PP2C family protein-serine/threonine phosphatase [Candidatus Latescibacterota bacterium]
MFNNKAFYRKLDALLSGIVVEERPHHDLARLVDQIVQAFREDLGTVSGRLYVLHEGRYYLRHSTAPLGDDLRGFAIPASYPPIQAILSERIVAVHEDFPGYDPELEERLGVRNFAAFALEAGRYVVSFGLDSHAEEEALLFALGAIQHSLSLRLKQAAMAAEISEAEAIQLSLLPPHPPHFAGFDISARTYAAEATEVGGDIHDFMELSEDALGIAVGDASGHGLPAALQARDVVTGLRMGVEKEMKITAVIRRLNQVIHASRLSTRFVSLFYGELERNGNLIYVNAGHCEPMVIGPGNTLERLTVGGVILGPTADANYRRGFTHVSPGRQLLLFTDGLVERRRGNEEYGEQRLLSVFRDCFELSSAETVESIVSAARSFGGEAPWEDDVTLLVVKPA